ncbi:MAG: right-handed parallel beta-helix repeat-containing protein [Bacteroidetes bacterium]|nr:right-handed parallel beta-helix repeat-containing protein [Bacteroidota bacterium]
MKNFTNHYKIAVLVTFLSVLSLQFSFATTYYVNASTGNDANNGTSASTPFLTVQKALNTASSPGDIILVAPGTYKQNLTWKFSGTSSAKITLQKNGSGTVYLKSIGASAAPVLQITNFSNIIIDGFTFTRDNAKNNAQGLLINSSGSYAMQNIEIKNCVFTAINWNTNPNKKPTSSKNSQPFIVYGRSTAAIQNINIHDCEFHDNVTGFSEVCSFNSNIDGFSATNNIIHDNTNIGIDVIGFEGENSNTSIDQARNGTIANNTFYENQSPYAEGASIYVDGGKSVLIERNLIHDGDYGIEISAENDPSSITYETQDITVRNNLIYNCRSAGLKIGNYKGKLQNALVVNNTCFYNNRGGKRDGDVSGTSVKFSAWAELVIDNMQDVKINDNIFYARSSNTAMINSDANAVISNLTMNYNQWYCKGNANGSGLTYQFKINGTNYNYSSFNSYQSSNSFGFATEDQYGNPLFVNEGISGNNAVYPDLHIQSSSPCIGQGDPSAIVGDDMGEWGTVDYFGNNRKVGTIDIGAHELATGFLQNKKNIIIQSLQFSPNPVTDFIMLKNIPKGKYIVRIANMQGNSFISQNIEINNVYKMSVAVLPKGSYVITVSDNNTVKSANFFKQ